MPLQPFELSLNPLSLLNTPAPDFEGESTGFNPLHLYRDFADTAVIIYFYPKDFTPICTTEANQFKKIYQFFENLHIKILGVSKDNLETHFNFKKEHHLPFDLVADEQHRIAKLYGVYDELFDLTKRVTFLLDKKHHIKAIYKNLAENEESIQKMIQEIQQDVIPQPPKGE